MSKLLHLKPWLSTQDAADLLSKSLQEQVTEADMYRFALDGHLRLSVYLPNGLTYLRFEVVDIDEVESRIGRGARYRSDWLNDADGRLVVCYEGEWLRLCDGDGLGTASIEGEGLLDIPMFGTERAEVEREFQRLSGGAVLLNRGRTFACVLTENGLAVAVSRLVPRADARDPDAAAAQVLHCLTDTGKFVVRPAELARFAAALSATPEATKRSASAETRRRRSLLTIIAALCKRARIDPSSRGAAAQIAAATAELGAPVTDETIIEALREIPDAVEARTK